MIDSFSTNGQTVSSTVRVGEISADGSAVHRETGEAVTVGRVEAMSKSKRNTVDPGEIIARYGADTARWFILSDNPPDRDIEWTESGVAGAYRFTQRVYRLAEAGVGLTPGAEPDTFGPPALALRRTTHRAIAALTEALESFAFNVAVARLYELANAIAEGDRAAAEPGMAWARLERAGIVMVMLLVFLLPQALREFGIAFDPVGSALSRLLPAGFRLILLAAGHVADG